MNLTDRDPVRETRPGSLLFQLLDTAHSVTARLAEALAELGLSPAGLDLLTELAQGAKACRCQRRVATIGGSWW